jgi:hypothetical protein
MAGLDQAGASLRHWWHRRLLADRACRGFLIAQPRRFCSEEFCFPRKTGIAELK